MLTLAPTARQKTREFFVIDLRNRNMNKQCYLCRSKEKDEVKFGEFMTRGKFSVHYFCLLLSSNLMQNGRDDEGFLGFLPRDIQIEAQRVKDLICCYCKETNANISCCASRCHKSFHLTCGEKNSTEHEFVGTFKSYCHRHVKGKKVTRPLPDDNCCICYENIFCPGGRFDTVKMIRAPCCKNGWFHKYCLAAFAKTAGYFFKCPLCNDCKVFRERLTYKGIFIPDRDAAWELEPNAFAELLERPKSCSATECQAEGGRESQTKRNEFLFCSTCGSIAIHRRCLKIEFEQFYCDECTSLTPSIQSASVANITVSQENNNENEEEDEEEIDVGEDLDVDSMDNSQDQTAYDVEEADETIEPLQIGSKNLNLIFNDELSSSDNGANIKSNGNVSNEDYEKNVHPLRIIKNFAAYKTVDDDSSGDDTDDNVISNGKARKRTNRLLSDDISDLEHTCRPCKRQKLLAFRETESLFDSGAESDSSESSERKCNEKSSLVNPNSNFSEKSDPNMKAFVRVKKIDNLEIEKRISRIFTSFNDCTKENIGKVKSRRCLSECMVTYLKSWEKQEDGVSKAYNMFEENPFDNVNVSTVDLEIKRLKEEVQDHFSNETEKTLPIHNFKKKKLLDFFELATVTTNKSPMRLRTRSEDFSKKSVHVERRKSFLECPYATSPQQITERGRSKIISDPVASSIKRNGLDSDSEHCLFPEKHEKLTFLYEDEINYKQLSELKIGSSRGRSPLSANLCDAYSYVDPEYVKKKVDKTNIPETTSVEATKSEVSPEVQEDLFSISYQNRPTENSLKSSGFLFARTNKSKTLKHKNSRISSHKSLKRIVLPSNQTKIESFFKKI